MIGSIDIKVNAARPNLPLAPLFAFQDSPSSLRVMDVPKSIGEWAITSVKVAIEYPDNTTVEKTAVRNGSVWVATFEGSEVAGKVLNGYSVLADGKDEDGNDVTGYVLGKGDVFILENDTELSRLVGKIAVRYVDDIPDVPTKGDLMNSNGELRLFDGNDWIVISTTEPPPVYDAQITIKKNGTPVGTFTVNTNEPKAIDIPVPSNTSDIVNDSGFITVEAIPSNVSEFNNDAGYITSEAIPSKISAFDNDVGYITESAIPSNVGAFTNDVGYLTSVSWGEVQDKPDVALKSDIPSKVSELDNDAGYITANALPSKVSELENDSGFITLAQVPPVPSNLSEYNNDVGFITASAIPSNVGAFTNDVGYLTTSSQAFVDKRDKTDMSAVVGTTYASWNLSELHSTTYSPALELKWGIYNVFGQKQECWLVDDEYRQLCFFLMPDLTMLFWGVKNQDGSYNAGYGETITLSSDELSIATINGVAEITCTRTSKDGTPEVSTIATLKDLSEYEGAQGKRDWWDNTYPASVDDSGKYTINNFSVMIGSNSYVLDQFSKSGSTSTWKTGGADYPSITTTDGLNFALNTDSSTYSNFSISQLKPGPATGTIGGNNYTALANFMLTTFALKDYVDGKFATKRDLTDISYSGKDEDAFFLGVESFTIELPDTWTATKQKTWVLDKRQKNATHYKLWYSAPVMFYINTLNDATFYIMDISSNSLGSFTWNKVKGGAKVAVTITYQGVQYSCHVQANWETTNLATGNDVVKMNKVNNLLQGENIRINTNGQSNIGILVANQYYNGYALTQSGIAKYDSNAATKAFNFPSGDATGSTFATREWVQSQGYTSGSVDDYVPVTIHQNLGNDSFNYQLQIYNHQLDGYMTYETNTNQMSSGYSTMNFMVFKVGSYTLRDYIDNNGVLDGNNWYVEYSDFNGNFYRSSWEDVYNTNIGNFLYVKVVKD